jgi:replicative DNA helicase
MAESIDIVKKSLIRRSEASVLDFGKLPPQARELEEAVLGAIMIEKSVMDEIAPFIKPEVFYMDAHQRIARAIFMLYIQQEPIDLLTVTEQLKQNGELDAAGGPYYIAQLTNKVGSAANAEYHVRVLFEKYVQRGLISTSTEIIRDAYEDTSDVFEIFDKAEKNLRALKQEFHTGSISTTATVLEEAKRQQLSGFVPSKHGFINKGFGGGWQKGTLNIVAARPGMGKSAFHVSELVHCVFNDSKCASFNLEMMQQQLITRVICNLSTIPNTRYRKKNFFAGDEEKVAQAEGWISGHDRNMTLDFTAGISVYDLISKMKRSRRKKDWILRS